MAYRPEFDEGADLLEISPRVWLRISFAISLAATMLLVPASLLADLVFDYRYSSDGQPTPILELLLQSLNYGLWLLLLNMSASAVAYLTLALIRRARR